MAFAPNITLPSTSNPNFDPLLSKFAHLPVSHLESLRFKAAQIIESIQTLQYTLDAGGNPHYMPSWPDILSKYNVLLSQTHNFSNALVNPLPTQASRLQGQGQGQGNIYERIALHPIGPMSDAVLDGEVIQLLRNQQTTDVLTVENDTVSRLAGHMSTKGSLGVLGTASTDEKPTLALEAFPNYKKKKPEYEDVLNECAEIAEAHDKRVDRALRAVLMLRDRFDWKQRVEVEEPEPEELDWDPRFGRREDTARGVATQEAIDVDAGEGAHDHGHGHGEESDSSDEDEMNGIQGALVDQAMDGLSPAPVLQQQDSPSDPLFSPSGSGVGLFGSDIMSPTSNGVFSPAGGTNGPMSPAGRTGTPMEGIS
ncbi:hypothetical protein BDQ17DRAFT_1367480 [Cyathus striatus]|nr:hypothetical protein BDQ17DRAFT_1367480 [Cyathus striatus]